MLDRFRCWQGSSFLETVPVLCLKMLKISVCGEKNLALANKTIHVHAFQPFQQTHSCTVCENRRSRNGKITHQGTNLKKMKEPYQCLNTGVILNSKRQRRPPLRTVTCCLKQGAAICVFIRQGGQVSGFCSERERALSDFWEQ